MFNKAILLLLLSFTFTQVSSALELNGIGSYQQLRKEYYIAALYLTTKSTDPATIRASNTSKRMSIKVTTKRWSPRRWSLQWQNDVAINNSFADDAELTNQLMMFTGFLGANLTKGDEIIIDYVAASGTVIKINDVLIIKTKTAQLFNYLLNAWIGKLPPSGEFKNRILGQSIDADNALLNSYNAVNYDLSRTQLVASWIKARKDAVLAEQRKKQNAEKAKLAKAQKAKDQAAKKAKAIAAAQKPKPKPTKTYAPPKKIAKKKVISKKKKIASVSSSNLKSKDKKAIAIESKYYLDLYRWELIREIRNAVEYPEWAKKFGQKGLVTLNFSVDRKAQVSNVTGDNADISVLLISELHRAILAVTPFILPPDALPGDKWSFSMAYQFDPKSDKQAFLKKPKKPRSLNSLKKVSRADYKKVLSQYIDNVKDIINDKIEYPVWAKKLNQKGSVSIEITINKDGTVTKIIDKELSRHETLNQEVRDAIEESSSLPAIPSQLKLNQTTILIKRNFN